ncbi:hypothetical protein COLO4_08984 [Corchorus olitorius]|uniref:Protein kinase domain-containing protein n=1 Tax=Corchorus olitorius TaxID=93759 RepID=A0A1R3KDX7_9ROSI|nr:hypothetical protein COLO4_08984 [Corchorus olitorius]
MAKDYLCVAPEVLRTNRISDKTDVYSFGLVLFEVLCCRRIFEPKLDEDQRCLDGWARKCYENGTMYNIIDPYLKGRIAPDCFKKFVEIAYDCISLEVNKRPTMGEVEIVLELVLELQKKAESEMDKMNPKGVVLNVGGGDASHPPPPSTSKTKDFDLGFSVPFMQKLRSRVDFGCGAQEFRTEVQFLCQLRHPNLVSLIGFCDEKNQMMLLYEYSGKGTLYDHLHGAHDPLPWNERLKICIGAARGLHYLHTGTKRAIIHRNINSSSILLDQEWGSKLSDFGYSVLGPFSMSNTSKKPKQELVGSQSIKGNSSNLSGFKCIENQTLHQIIDPYLKGRIAPECFRKFVETAYNCVAKKGNDQPAMGEVELMLELALELQIKADYEMEALPEELCRQFSLAEIKAATNNFHKDMIIAEGGLGLVYKGFIDDGALLVAIKRWTSWMGGIKALRREAQMLCQLHHPNIVSLIGFCDESGEMIRVYECIEDGTIYNIIDPYLKGKIAPECLKKFVEIACGCVSFDVNKRPAMGEVEVALELALELQRRADTEMKILNPQG